MQDDTVYRSMLFDFFGELLTRKQRECFDLHYNEDYSLAEIAEECKISRQAVWDNIRRAEETLREFESKTGIIKRFYTQKEQIAEIRADVIELASKCSNDELKHELSDISRRLSGIVS